MTRRAPSSTLSRRSLLQLASGMAGAAGLGMLTACGGAATATTSGSMTGPSATAASTSTQPATTPTQSATTVATSSGTLASAPATSASTQTSAASARSAAVAAGATSVVGWFNIGPSNQQAWDQTASEFEAQHAGVKVSINVLPGHTTDQEAKLESLIAGGSLADVIYVHPIYNAAFATKGVIVALDPYISQSKGQINLEDFYPGTVGYFRWAGKLWSLPNTSFPGVFYYNTDLLKRQGIADPWTLFQKGQWTIQEYDNDVTKLVSGEGATKVFGCKDVDHSFRFQSPWIQGFGGQLWNAEATQALLADDPAVQAWDYLASRVTKGYAPTSAELKGVPNGILGLFTSGRLAFYFGLRSDVPSMKNLAFGVVPVHQMPNGKYYNRDGPNGISITQQSSVKDAAWQFELFEVSRGVELTMAAGFTAPTTRTLAKQKAWLSLLVSGETPEAYSAAAEQVQAIVLPVRATEIDTVVEDAYGKILSGQTTAKSAMTAILPQVNSMLATASS